MNSTGLPTSSAGTALASASLPMRNWHESDLAVFQSHPQSPVADRHQPQRCKISCLWQQRFTVDPTASTSPTSNARVTDASSDWNSASSDIIPNFGDYTDIYFNASSGLFVAWSDGRTNDPQPFNARKK